LTDLLLSSEAPESGPRASPSDAGRSPEPPRSARLTVARARPLAAIRETLRAGRFVGDHVFDEVFPESARLVSSVYWTPVRVALRAARLLADRPGSTILDVGAGVGKFCIVAAAARDARVVGVEHRPHLVDIARNAAAQIGVEVDLHHGTLESHDPTRFDGIYLFNPFAENLSPPQDRLDETVVLSEERFWRDIEITEQFLRDARVGTRVVTYCGWGGGMPAEYHRVLRESRAGTFELWIKSSVARWPSCARTASRGSARRRHFRCGRALIDLRAGDSAT
jgi:SAM-dependent methyltransferase